MRETQKEELYLGADLGGSHFSIVAITKDGEVIAEEVYNKSFTEVSKDRINGELTLKETQMLEILSNLIIDCYGKIDKSKYTVDTIGFGMPGTFEGTFIIISPNIGIKDLDIWEELQKKINQKMENGETDLDVRGFSAYIENDATVAFITELSREDKQSIILTLGTGCGTKSARDGIIEDNDSEMGHIPFKMDLEDEELVGDNELVCGCGELDCVERYISVKRYREYVSKMLGYNVDNGNRDRDETIDGIELEWILCSSLDREPTKQLESQVMDPTRATKVADLTKRVGNLSSEDKAKIQIRHSIWKKSIARAARNMINAYSKQGHVKVILGGNGKWLLSKVDIQDIEAMINDKTKGTKRYVSCNVVKSKISDPAIGAALIPTYYKQKEEIEVARAKSMLNAKVII